MDEIKRFLGGNGYGNGYGSGKGYGNGYGSGNGNGYGYGSGNGDGDGYGSGTGDGTGDGYGYGYGSGDGYGYGSGNGDGMLEFDGFKVYMIDDVPTCIESVRGIFAKGFTVEYNSVKKPCYIAKIHGFFAHGETLHDAVRDAQLKYNANLSDDERIAIVTAKYTLDSVIPNRELFKFHNMLTGSCEFGRKQFCKEQNISIEDSMTLREFIDLTKNSYGGTIIEKLRKSYE